MADADILYSRQPGIARDACRQLTPVRRLFCVARLLAVAVLREPVQLQHKRIADIFHHQMANNDVFNPAAAIAG